MKNKLIPMVLFTLSTIVWSCGEKNKKKNHAEKKVAKTENIKKNSAKNQIFENLRNTPTVKVTDLKTWIPKTLGGLSLERTKSHSIFNEVQMMGFYKRKGDKIINLSITDAAGPNGEMAADKINVFGAEREFDMEHQQHRSVNVKGRLARQIYETEANMTVISFFHKKRFMIRITAHDHNVEETWALVDELDFETLNKLIQ